MNQTTTIPPKKNNFDPFAGPAIARVIITPQAQLEIWTSCLIGGENANRAYNESVTLEFTGRMDHAALDRALQSVVQRHEALRAVFSTDGLFMSIFETLSIELYLQDLSQLSSEQLKDAIIKYQRKDADYIFDLINGPLLKAGLLKISENKHLFVFTAHHIVCDGWSLGIILQDLGELYSAYLKDKKTALSAPESFTAYADRQQALIESDAYKKTEKFWLEKFSPPLPQLELPLDFPRPSLRTYQSHRLDFELDRDLLAAVKKTGLLSGCGLVTTLLSAFEVFLYRLTGQDDVVVGLPSAGQSATGMHQLVGHCVNLLPLRSKIPTDIPFTAYLKQRKSDLLDAYEHQQLSFGQLLQKLSIARDPSRVPLAPVVFNIDLGMADGVSFTDLSYSLKNNPRHYETFELFLNASGTEDNLIFEWSYNAALFESRTIQKMMASFEQVLIRITTTPSSTVDHIAQIDRTPYTDLNATKADYPHIPLHELLAERALEFPLREAIKFGDTSIPYDAMYQKVNQLAHYLSAQGVQKGDFVGVALPRSEKLPLVLLAILQCGAAYLPLDPDYPARRLEFMLEDSKAPFLLTTQALTSSLKTNCTIVPIDTIFCGLQSYPTKPLSVSVRPDDAAYLLYTSGSTGTPKGVPISHKNLVNFLCSMVEEPGIAADDRLLAITTISFDIAGLEFYLPLLEGATIVLADSETVRDGRLLIELLKSEGITLLQATPTTWQMLLDSGWTAPLPLKALCGGEALSKQLAQQLLERCDELWNMYGPTETTVWSAVKKIHSNDDPITIGHPIANMQLYIINENDQLMAPGTIGEIGIGGDGVSNGYWMRPDLTAEKFRTNAFGSNNAEVVYRTGDLGTLLPSGEIQCLGRTDQQVKIHGHRIEPGEIEQLLTGFDDLSSAVVLAHNNRLIAHVVPAIITDAEARIPQWKASLQTQLPAFLIPKEFRIWETLPTTPNGKLDRRALLEYQEKSNEDRTAYTAPRTDNEKLIAQLWQECLNLEKVDIFSDFFELGGHSLLAARVMARIEQKTDKRLPLSVLLEHPTIEKLALLLDGHGNSILSETLVPIQAKGEKNPLYLIHGLGLTVLKFKDLVKHLDDDQPVYGLQGIAPTETEGTSENVTIEEIAADYINTIIKSNPEGPYALAGHSYGGVVAYEMARQLTQQGKRIKALIILDTYLEPHFYFDSPVLKKMAMVGHHTGRLLHLGKEMLSSWTNFKFHINRKKEYFLERYFRKASEKSEQQLELQQIEEVDAMNEKIMRRYRIVPENLEIELFRAEELMNYLHDPVHLGWKDIAVQGINLHDVPGTHLDMFSSPNDKVIARILQRVLDRDFREN